MKLVVSGLLALCVFVFFDAPTITGLYDMPAVTNTTLYLVGYSQELYDKRYRCINTTYEGRQHHWVQRNLYVTYNFSGLTNNSWYVPIEVRNLSNNFYLEVNQTPILKGLFRLRKKYLIWDFDNNSLVLSERIQSIRNLTPPCSLWVTRDHINLTTVPSRANYTFFTFCSNPMFIGYNDSCFGVNENNKITCKRPQ
nr:uncharacterized protein LOC119179295 [Rhipicephalus microplus]